MIEITSDEDDIYDLKKDKTIYDDRYMTAIIDLGNRIDKVINTSKFIKQAEDLFWEYSGKDADFSDMYVDVKKECISVDGNVVWKFDKDAKNLFKGRKIEESINVTNENRYWMEVYSILYYFVHEGGSIKDISYDGLIQKDFYKKNPYEKWENKLYRSYLYLPINRFLWIANECGYLRSEEVEEILEDLELIIGNKKLEKCFYDILYPCYERLYRFANKAKEIDTDNDVLTEYVCYYLTLGFNAVFRYLYPGIPL